MSAVVVFSGPTLPPDEAEALCPGARCLGPAACGDVLRAHREGARTIVLVDGYFEHTRSVWHKEILWALHEGARVYGASSLGALRAVELARFGMVGVGRVFEWFRDGVLEDDDEVALAHEAADRRYRPISEALVNIRVTLSAAVRAGVVSEDVARALVDRQKARFYPARGLPGLERAPDTRDLVAAAGPALLPWLRSHRVDQKRADALDVLAAVGGAGARAASGPAGEAGPEASSRPPDFEFAYTDAWHELVTRG